MLHKLVLTLLVVMSSAALFSQEKDKKDEKPKWDVSNPYTADWKINEVPLNTDEGTWMSLDVSPNGSKIVFDLLGDIYSMPVSGGEAKALRTGMPYEVQPRFSPDGKRISFV